MTASTKTLPGALYTAVFSDTDIDATMTTVSSSAQRIHQIDAYNPNGTAVWLRVYISSSDEVGTHDPRHVSDDTSQHKGCDIDRQGHTP